MIIDRSFYARDTVVVARQLLGKILVREINGVTLSGIIVETEAYRGNDDPASHAYRGKTKRNAPMFQEVGHLYVYFIYGNHFCCNVVAKKSGASAGAVLIRAIEPVNGIDLMRLHRTQQKSRQKKQQNVSTLTNGPGKLTQALQITKGHSGIDVTRCGCVYVLQGQAVEKMAIKETPRIGINVGLDKRWRFYVSDSSCVLQR